MFQRQPPLQNFLDRLEASIVGNEAASAAAVQAAGRIFTALRDRVAAPNAVQAARLPVCRHLAPAFAAARQGPAAARDLAAALEALEPSLAWRRRAGAEAQGGAFADSHANTMIVGPAGIEPREDAWVGVSLVAPGVTYPDHQHPPEEIYSVLSSSEWRQRADAWIRPGIGGIVYNPPGIVHAMRAGSQPLLAVWCLWV